MEKNEERETKLNFIVILVIALFFYNFYNFINIQGSKHPLVASLFNMIISLAILIFLYLKNEIMKDQKNG